MPRVTMIKTISGYPDHVRPKKYVAGESYEIPDFLRSCFLAANAIEIEKPQESKEKEKPPHPNKMNKRGRKTKG